MSPLLQDGSAASLGCAGLLSLVLLAGCGGSDAGSPASSTGPGGTVNDTSPPAVIQAKEQNTPVDPSLVTADNTFGVNLLQTLIQAKPDTNIAISPTSVAMALQIVYNGASGTTQAAMAQTLQLGSLSVSQLNDDNAALSAALLNPDPQITLTIANSLWVRLNSNPVSATFISTDQTYYGAQIGDLAGAPADVNAWGNTATNGLIPQILSPNVSLSDINALVANVVYFKGTWEYSFDPAKTAAAPFTLANGTQTSVDMMSQPSSAIPVLLGANFSAVALPYGQSGRMSMIVVLPNTGVDWSAFMSAMTVADIQGWVGQMSVSVPVNLSLPRFTTSFGTSVKGALATLGMGVAFGAEADLSGIYPGAEISDVEHETVVKVDETGTEAAGATIVGITATVVMEPITVQINHPFFYAIRDNQTGALLFIGVMMNPNGG